MLQTMWRIGKGLEKRMIEFGLLAYLFLIAIIDLRKRALSWWSLFPAFFIIVITEIILKSFCWNSIFGSAIGCVLIIISLWSGEKIGLADGIVFCTIGVALGIWKTLLLLFLSLCLSSIFCLIGMFRKKYSRFTKIPFLPFVCMGEVYMLLIEKL